tara:strand:+ start:18 stop:554 length:537 start_codon:yes stop_codon:yes gene_type:complete
MASIINVDQIRNAAGTSAVTIDASTGKPSFPNGATLPAGSVLQVVFNEYGTQTTMPNSTYTNSGLSASITPKSSTSKILILVRPHLRLYSSNSDTGLGFRILRNNSNVVFISTTAYDTYVYDNGGHAEFRGGLFVQAFDAPATTSSTAYSLQGVAYGGTVTMQNAGNFSQMTLMEIAQ